MVPGNLRPTKGSYANKFNRAAKLFRQFSELDEKFKGMVRRGKQSETGRLALATLVMMHTGIRIGNESSAEGYMTKPHPFSAKAPEFVHTYGLTTLLAEHCLTSYKKVRLQFLGKKQVDNYFEIADLEVSKQLKDLAKSGAGEETLFFITAPQLSRFVKKYVGAQFTPKDFRCMRANMEACEFVTKNFKRKYATKKEFRSDVKSMFEHVAIKLNNTPGVCKKSYVDDFMEGYLETKYFKQ